jgi:hypothetical protein
MPKDKNGGGVQIPEDLSSLTDEQLGQLDADIVAEFEAITGDENINEGGLARAGELADHLDNVRGENGARVEAKAALAAKRDELTSRVHPPEPDAETEPLEGELVDAGVTAAGQRKRTDVRDVIKDGSKLNVRLSSARNAQPEQRPDMTRQFDAAVLVASSNIPGFTDGGRINDYNELTRAYKQRARSLGVTRALEAGQRIYGPDPDGKVSGNIFLGHDGDWRSVPRFPIAQLQRAFKYMLNDLSKPEEAWEVMQAAANPAALVAAGGWCSPSEIRYDFYDIAEMDGAVDLPVTGINRGGLRWPTSPSFGDMASFAGLWHWNETQDIAAATGTAQSGTKTCGRLPCASFNEVRLEGEGICLTAGNLSTDAWPEQLANFLRLVNVGHFHRVNKWFIDQMVTLSTAVSIGATGQGFAVPVLDSIEMQAIDIRTKYAMSDNAVLEAKFPSWVMGMFRADLAKRKGYYNGASSFDISDAEIRGWFTRRNISVQLVQDYQVRTSGLFGQSSALTAWPSSLSYMLYPAGTFLRGNGLNLDLGIVRDSTLNATNDYTAAWSEEFFTLAKIGHESRVITVPVNANGAVGADVTYPLAAL